MGEWKLQLAEAFGVFAGSYTLKLFWFSVYVPYSAWST